MTAVSDETGRDWLPLKYEDGPDFCTVTFATGAAFALTVHPERMKLMEAALSASPVAQEPVARLCGYCKTWNSKPCGEQCYLQPNDPVWTSPPASPVAQEPVASDDPYFIMLWNWFEKRRGKEDMRAIQNDGGLSVDDLETMLDEHEADLLSQINTPPAPSAGVGADEIARVFARWKRSKNLHESLAAQNIEKELLALLSRGGDQSNSTHEA